MSTFLSGPHSRSAKVCEDAVRDPFLRSVDNVNVAFPLGSGDNSSDIGSRYEA